MHCLVHVCLHNALFFNASSIANNQFFFWVCLKFKETTNYKNENNNTGMANEFTCFKWNLIHFALKHDVCFKFFDYGYTKWYGIFTLSLETQKPIFSYFFNPASLSISLAAPLSLPPGLSFLIKLHYFSDQMPSEITRRQPTYFRCMKYKTLIFTHMNADTL